MRHNKPLLVAGLFALALVTGCHHKATTQLRIGVTPGPAEEILSEIEPQLASQGVQLQVVHFTDYIQPNLALAGHDLDANLYQNVPFLENFNRDHSTHFVAVQRVYIPLMAIYPGKTKTLAALQDGARVSLPNDPVNQARALNLLQSVGLLTLKPNVGSTATLADVVSSKHDLKLVEVDASQLPSSRADVDLAVINANFALDAGLNAIHDSLAYEPSDSIYANVLATNEGVQQDPRIVKLAAALHSDATKAYISSHYGGAVLPAS